uniref:Uridine kinase n=1 Tax=uncultured organism TaxID=155900 RepID=M1Q2F3_9ZZZZ|nr:uridine kinase [uncultured organism]
MILVGIAGGTGSGKTTLANTLIDTLEEENTIFIPHDNYYKDRSHLPFSERKNVNYDHPDAFETDLLVSHLKKLQADKTINMPQYDYSTHTRKDKTIEIKPKPVIIIEGILVLADEKLRNLFDIKLFVDTDSDIRILRRLKRDINDRNRTFESVYDQYLTTVKPMHEAFVEPSKSHADIIIPEGGMNDVANNLLLTKLESYIAERTVNK